MSGLAALGLPCVGSGKKAGFVCLSCIFILDTAGPKTLFVVSCRHP